MSDGEDYIEIVAQMPRYDNDGIEVTNETLGSGGSRRDDGTLSAMVKNPRIPDDDTENGEEGSDYDSPADDPGLLEVAIGLGVGIVTTVVVVRVAPKVRIWWVDSALPEFRTRWNKFVRKQEPGNESIVSEILAPVNVEPAEVSTALAVVSEDEQTIMSSTEAQQRYLAMMMAAAFAVKEMRALSAANIEDPEKLLELKEAVSQLSTQETVDLANRMLEANSSLLDKRAEAVFTELFGGGVRVEGEYLAIEKERLEHVLRLNDDQLPSE